MRKNRISVQQLFDANKDLPLCLAGGQENIYNPIESLQIIEDAYDLTQPLYYTLVYLSKGIFSPDKTFLLKLLTKCVTDGAGAILIREDFLSKQSFDIIYDFCEKNKLPFITIDALNNVSSILNSLYVFINASNEKNRQLFHAVKDAVSFPEKINRYMPVFKSYGFREEDSYLVVTIQLDEEMTRNQKQLQNCVLSIESMLLRNGDRSFILRFDDHFFILLSNYTINEARFIINQIHQICQNFNIQYIGSAGNLLVGMNQINKSFMQAQAINRINLAKGIKNQIVVFFDLGIEKLVLSDINNDFFRDIYMNTYEKLLNYDASQNTDLVSLVEAYLDSDSNITNTSKRLFIHRNTVSYKLHQIENIINMPIEKSTTKIFLYIAQCMYRINTLKEQE